MRISVYFIVFVFSFSIFNFYETPSLNEFLDSIAKTYRGDGQDNMNPYASDVDNAHEVCVA